LIYGNDGEKLEYKMPEDNYEFLEETLIAESKNFFNSFVSTISPNDQDIVAKNLIYITQSNGVTSEFLKYIIKIEIQNCKTAETIFRENSIASKMFKTWSKIIGSEYLFYTLGKYIQQLEAIAANKDNLNSTIVDINIEVDQDKTNDEIDLETNSFQLQFVCNKIFSAILKSTEEIPKDFFEIFSTINVEIENLFGEGTKTVYDAIGGLFFLRFVISSIFAPHVYGLLPEPPSQITQRQLVLVAKILQSIANMANTGKEDFLKYCEKFIVTSIPKVKEFYQSLTARNDIGLPLDTYEVPFNAKLNALASIYTMIYQNKDQIKENMETLELPDFYIFQLENIIQTYGEPKIKKEKKKKKEKL